MRCPSKFCLDGFGFFFVARFFEQGKHVFLVCLNAGLVEWVHSEDISADAAGSLEEIDELSESSRTDIREDYAHNGHSAVDMCYADTVLCVCDYVKAKKRSKKTINLSFDEWNVWYHSDHAPFERWSVAPPRLEDIYNFEDALVVGSMLITLLRHCDRIKIACLAQLVNVIAPIFTQTGGGVFKQTIFYPFEHLSNYGRGVALNPIISCPKHDTKRFTDVPYLEAIAAFDEENETMTVFCVNKSLDDSVVLDMNLMDFDGYRPFEFISMDGYHKNDANSIENPFVKPHNNPLPDMDGNILTAQLKPFSWNVIRLKKV